MGPSSISKAAAASTSAGARSDDTKGTYEYTHGGAHLRGSATTTPTHGQIGQSSTSNANSHMRSQSPQHSQASTSSPPASAQAQATSIGMTGVLTITPKKANKRTMSTTFQHALDLDPHMATQLKVVPEYDSNTDNDTTHHQHQHHHSNEESHRSLSHASSFDKYHLPDEEESISLDGGDDDDDDEPFQAPTNANTSGHSRDSDRTGSMIYGCNPHDGSASSVSMEDDDDDVYDHSKKDDSSEDDDDNNFNRGGNINSSSNDDDDDDDTQDDDIDYAVFASAHNPNDLEMGLSTVGDDDLLSSAASSMVDGSSQGDLSSPTLRSSSFNTNSHSTAQGPTDRVENAPDITPKETEQLNLRWNNFWRLYSLGAIVLWIGTFVILDQLVSSSKTIWITTAALCVFHLVWATVTTVIPIRYYLQPSIEGRHAMANLAASKSQAIVSSLFPTVVHDRLFQSQHPPARHDASVETIPSHESAPVPITIKANVTDAMQQQQQRPGIHNTLSRTSLSSAETFSHEPCHQLPTTPSDIQDNTLHSREDNGNVAKESLLSSTMMNSHHQNPKSQPPKPMDEVDDDDIRLLPKIAMADTSSGDSAAETSRSKTPPRAPLSPSFHQNLPRPPKSVSVRHSKRLSNESQITANDSDDMDISRGNRNTGRMKVPPRSPKRTTSSESFGSVLTNASSNADRSKKKSKRFKQRFSLLSSSSHHTTAKSSTSSRNIATYHDDDDDDDDTAFDGNGSFASMAEDIMEDIPRSPTRKHPGSRQSVSSAQTNGSTRHGKRNATFPKRGRSSSMDDSSGFQDYSDSAPEKPKSTFSLGRARSSRLLSSESLLPPWQRLRNFLSQDGGTNNNNSVHVPAKPKSTTSLSNAITSATNSTHHHRSSASSSIFRDEPPIADLFPNCTVLFADIAGFTAWSSTREPAQVFTLLETIYRAFDRAARKYVVFKVETIGDCYVAVTGLPEPQEDHAVRMTRFAKECLVRLHDLTRHLEVRLGPETGDLGLRVGLHSGPVTAGVLRGDKSRFQLFGDSVNTAARMESTGKAGYIQLSSTTAELLENANKGFWKAPREETVDAKGIGEMQTYWALPRAIGSRSSSSGANMSLNVSNHSMQSMQSFRTTGSRRASGQSANGVNAPRGGGGGRSTISNSGSKNDDDDDVRLVMKKKGRGPIDSYHRRRASNDSQHHGRPQSMSSLFSAGNSAKKGKVTDPLSITNKSMGTSNGSLATPFSPPTSRHSMMNSSRNSLGSLASRHSMINSVSGDLWGEAKYGRFGSGVDSSGHPDVSEGAEEESQSEIDMDDASAGDLHVALDGHELEREDSNRQERLIEWNVKILTGLLKQICAHRQSYGVPEAKEAVQLPKRESGSTALDEVTEIIYLSNKNGNDSQNEKPAVAIDPSTVELHEDVIEQLREYVTMVACMYRDNFFHNFEHASHVTMSAQKLLKRVVTAHQHKVDRATRAAASPPKSGKASRKDGSPPSPSSNLTDYTDAITADPLIQFAIVFSALIHDVDHTGVPNSQLVKEEAHIAGIYKNRCVAEQNSLDLAWQFLVDPSFKDLQRCIFANASELERFRQVVVNVVMATDIFDPDMKLIRNSRWDKAFHNESPPLSHRDEQNLKATIVIEYIMQASDVSHTMQHWKVYQTWNERLFHEMYSAFCSGRGGAKDPASGWYKGELWFFDNYIIPLAKKLKECRVFGAASDECLNYALANRKEWASRGEEMVKGYLRKYENAKK